MGVPSPSRSTKVEHVDGTVDGTEWWHESRMMTVSIRLLRLIRHYVHHYCVISTNCQCSSHHLTCYIYCSFDKLFTAPKNGLNRKLRLQPSTIRIFVVLKHCLCFAA